MDAHKYHLNRSLKSAYTVGLVCFSLLPLPSESAWARLLEDEKQADQAQVALVVPATTNTDQLRASHPQLCDQALPRPEEHGLATHQETHKLNSPSLL